jgi:hypothetical protein
MASIRNLEFQPYADLIGTIDLESVANRSAGRQRLIHIGLDGGLGLLPEIIGCEREDETFRGRCARSDLLAILLR